jgi:hypothetical protein
MECTTRGVVVGDGEGVGGGCDDALKGWCTGVCHTPGRLLG